MADARNRRIAGALVAWLLVTTLPAATAPPAAASAPWRFTERAATVALPINAITDVPVDCPEGQVPVGAGVANVGAGPTTFEIVGGYRLGLDSPRYQAKVHNYGTTSNTATVHAVCAEFSQTSGTQIELGIFNRDPDTGIAAGLVACPGGFKALIGGADWSFGAGDTRRVDFQGPTAAGTAWQARGWSPNAGAQLAVEAYCIPDAAIGAAAIASTSTTYTSASTDVTASVHCPAGSRPGAGGIEAISEAGGPGSTQFLGNDWYSAPSITGPSWSMRSAVEANVTLRRNVWCLPAGQPTISFTQQPPSRTSSTDATFSYTLGDTASEPLETVSCLLDGGGVSCNQSGATLNGLAPGGHTFAVTATNASYQSTTQHVQWVVDQTPPSLLTPLPSPQVTGPVRIGFSEPVTGLDGLTITEVGKASPLSGSLRTRTPSGGMTALFTPTAPLIAGERYDVSVPATITDLAGNPIVEQTIRIRTALAVENTSPVMTHGWDRDTNGAASGGGYIESSSSGSRATWTVTAAEGQQAVLGGLKRPDGGNATIFVDGVPAKVVSFYRSAAAWQPQIFTSAPLSAGTHSIAVRVDGTKPSASSGTWVMPDSLTLGGSVHQETSAVQRFRRVAATSASGGSYDTVTHKTSGDNGGGPRFLLVFDGTGIKGYVTKAPQSGAADVYVDGVKKATVNLASGSAIYKALGFTVTGLTAGRHTLRLQPVGSASGAGSAVGLDRIVIS